MTEKCLALFVLVFLLAACAPPLHVNFFPGAGAFPPTSPASVDLLRSELLRPHEAFAEIRMDPPARMNRFEVERRLRERAAAIGADALIIEVDNVFRERVWVGPYRANRGPRDRRTVVRDHIIIALAIRYH